MKKIFTFSNIQAILFLILSVAETVIMALFKPYPVIMIVVMQICSLMAIALIRFAYQIEYISNVWHSIWHRNSANIKDDEPSDFAVFCAKATGYFVLLAFSIALFFD